MRSHRPRGASIAPIVVALVATLLAPAMTATGALVARNIGWQSANWAGYVVESGPYSGVSGQWTVPTVSSSQTGFSAAWLGIDGVTNHQLIQVGTSQDYYGGRAHYSAWWEILPASAVHITSLRIRPGDHITASIKRISGKTWRITISDGIGTFTTTRSYSGTGTSAEWIVEAPVINDRQARLAKHAPVRFDLLRVNNHNPRLTSDEAGVLVQFHRRVATPSAPDAERDGFTVRRL